jgi:hypothetical protein
MWSGTVATGGGNASKHMAADNLPVTFREFGYSPVPGSLNLQVDTVTLRRVQHLPPVVEHSTNRYRAGNIFRPVLVNGYPCHVTVWRDRLEAVAPVRLRERLGLRDGGTVAIEPRTTVSAVVMAHPRRGVWAEQLAADLDCQIVWDRHNELWDTARRAWLSFDPQATHHVVVQDDAVLSADLLDGLRLVAANAGNRPVGLYFGGTRPRIQETAHRLAEARQAGEAFCEMDGPLWAVAVMIPTGQIGAMVAYGDRKPNIPADDSKMSRFFKSLGVGCWYTVPSLVDHRWEDNPSLVGEQATVPRRAQWFCNGSALDVDWSRWPAAARWRGGTMNVYRHVRTGNEVKVIPGSGPEKRLQDRPHHWMQVVETRTDVEPSPPFDVDKAVDDAATGGGWYHTPDGGKVRGRDAAVEAWTR